MLILLLIATLSQPLQADEGCEALISITAQYQAQEVSRPNTGVSFLYDSRWLLDQLFQNGWYVKLQSADPDKEHHELLSVILQEAIKEYFSNAFPEEGSEVMVYSDISDLTRPQFLNKIMRFLKINPAPYAENWERIKASGAEKARLPIYIKRLQYYSQLKRMIADRVASRTVTLAFYQVAARMMERGFSKTENNFANELANIEKYERDGFLPDNERGWLGPGDESINLSVFAKLNNFDFIELYPFIYPRGTEFSDKISYDGIVTDAKNYGDHDQYNHNRDIRLDFSKSVDLKKKYLGVRKFLIAERKYLTAEEELIVNATIGHMLHEFKDGAARFVDIFSANYNPANESDQDMDRLYVNLEKQYFAEHGEWIHKSSFKNLRTKFKFQGEYVRVINKLRQKFFEAGNSVDPIARRI